VNVGEVALRAHQIDHYGTQRLEEIKEMEEMEEMGGRGGRPYSRMCM
jgi:hypothetical protein